MKKNNTRKKTAVPQKSAKLRAVAIPIIGTVSDAGIRLKANDVKEEEKRARREARTVASFLNGGSPDFLTEAMLVTIDDAFEHFGLPRPQDDGGPTDYDEQNLQPLFLKTKLTSWNDLWKGRERLATAISDILTSEETPPALFNTVADFVMEASSGDVRKFWTVPMLEHVLEFHETKREEEVSRASN